MTIAELNTQIMILASERYIRCGGYVPESAYERRLRIERQIAVNLPYEDETIEEYEYRIANEVHKEIPQEERKLVRK